MREEKASRESHEQPDPDVPSAHAPAPAAQHRRAGRVSEAVFRDGPESSAHLTTLDLPPYPALPSP